MQRDSTVSEILLRTARLIADTASVREGQDGGVATNLSQPPERHSRRNKTKVNQAYRKGTLYHTNPFPRRKPG